MDLFSVEKVALTLNQVLCLRKRYAWSNSSMNPSRPEWRFAGEIPMSLTELIAVVPGMAGRSLSEESTIEVSRVRN